MRLRALAHARRRAVAQRHRRELPATDKLTPRWALAIGLRARMAKKISADLGACLVLVRLAGIEPTTLGFGGQYSIH